MPEAEGNAQDIDWKSPCRADGSLDLEGEASGEHSEQEKQDKGQTAGGAGAEQEGELRGISGVHWGHQRYQRPKWVGCEWVWFPARGWISGAEPKRHPVWGLGIHSL